MFTVIDLCFHIDAVPTIASRGQHSCAASAEGVQLWLTKVFPSLFPFLVACGILLRIGAAQRMGAALRPLMQPLFHLPGIAAFPFFFGLLSGYPMGAKLTAQLYEQRQLSLADAQQLLAFSNCPGPLFLIGTVGVGFFGMPAFGYLLWLSAFLGAVATGILFRRKKSVPTFHSVSVPSYQTLTEVLSASVADALRTILLIGGYLILFAVLSAAMEQAGLFSLLSRLLFFLPLSTETLRGLCSGILEMTNGAHLLSLSPDGLRRLCDAVLNTCGGRCACFSGSDETGYKYAVGQRGGDLRTWVKTLNQTLNGRGGGKPDFVQGSLRASRADIEAYLAE